MKIVIDDVTRKRETPGRRFLTGVYRRRKNLGVKCRSFESQMLKSVIHQILEYQDFSNATHQTSQRLIFILGCRM